MRTVTLLDGTAVDSASEAWRHECEARHVANLPARSSRQDYIEKVAAKRGHPAAQQLQALATTFFNAERKAPQR